MAFWQAFAPFLTSKLTFEKSSDYPFVFIETITSMMKFIMVIFPLCFRWHSFQLYFQQIIQIKVTNDSRVRFLFHFLWNVFLENSFHTSLSLINHNKRFHEQKFSKYYFFKNFFKYCKFFWKKEERDGCSFEEKWFEQHLQGQKCHIGLLLWFKREVILA